MWLVIDIDHTIADSFWRDEILERAGHYDGIEKFDKWEEYHSASKDDKSIADVVRMIQGLHTAGWQIIALTARDDKWRALTNRWLIDHHCPIDTLLMRPVGNYDTTPIAKLKLLKEYFKDIIGGWPNTPLIIMDDREDVVKAFKVEGLTVMQVHVRRNK